MSFKENAEEIGLIVDLMTFVAFLGLWLYGISITFALFFWVFSFIITRYMAMCGWKRCINTLKEMVKR